jgi:hypothetical protein
MKSQKRRTGKQPEPASNDDFVDHPRFGRRPRSTGLDVTDSGDGRIVCHWHSPIGVRIPGTAIAADTTLQARATVAVTHYYDARRVCRVCRRPFLFYAEEQKHWYEELRFPLEADCLECASCRKDAQYLQASRRRYEALLAATARTDDETLAMVDAALVLVESSVFSPKVLPRLRGALKALLADARSPSHGAARRLLSRAAASVPR